MRVVKLPHEPLKTSTYVVVGERLLPPPPTLNDMVTAVAVGDVAKRNHLSYVVEAPVHEPATPSLTASFIIYVTFVQLAEGVIVVATVPQVSAPGVCANELIDKNITSPNKIRTDKRA